MVKGLILSSSIQLPPMLKRMHTARLSDHSLLYKSDELLKRELKK